MFSIMLFLGFALPGVGSAEESVYPASRGTHQSKFIALTKPEIKWSKPFEGDITHMVIDSRGVIYALSDHDLSVKLTAVNPDGQIL